MLILKANKIGRKYSETATVYCEKSRDGLQNDIVYKYIYITFFFSNKVLASRDLLERKGPLLCLLLNHFIHITAWTILENWEWESKR